MTKKILLVSGLALVVVIGAMGNLPSPALAYDQSIRPSTTTLNITQHRVVNQFSDAVVIEWTTDIAQKMKAHYSRNIEEMYLIMPEQQAVSNHRIMLTSPTAAWPAGSIIYYSFEDEVGNFSPIYDTTIGTEPVGVYTGAVHDVSTSAINSTGFNISWSTKIPSTAEIQIFSANLPNEGIRRYESRIDLIHSMAIDGLNPGTKYYIRIKPIFSNLNFDFQFSSMMSKEVIVDTLIDQAPIYRPDIVSNGITVMTGHDIAAQTDLESAKFKIGQQYNITQKYVGYNGQQLPFQGRFGAVNLITGVEEANQLDPAASNANGGGIVGVFGWTPKSIGNYRLVFNLDPDNRIAELNDGNNEFMKNVIVTDATTLSGTSTDPEAPIVDMANKPDLVIIGVDYVTREMVINEKFYTAIDFVVNYKNMGASTLNGLASAFKVSVKSGATNGYPGGYRASMTKSESEFIAINQVYKAMLGSYLLARGETLNTPLTFGIDLAFEDPNAPSYASENTNKVTESNENNNIFVKNVIVPKAVQISEEIQDGNKYHDSQISAINSNAKYLNDGRLHELLTQIKLLRSELREQASELKYLKIFATQMKALNANMQTAMKAFITYGVDDNTKKLGEGERAAVISSYQSAFNKLPQTESELADAIKIANGRYPSATSSKAEQRAKDQFFKIYKRVPDMLDANDTAAIKVMAYGLRQKAQNRNLNSEKVGIKTFNSIFGNGPKTTEDWNVMQAVTYSGATKKVDADKDGLADETEVKIGTDPKNSDSDGDGHNDGTEVLKGFNPSKK